MPASQGVVLRLLVGERRLSHWGSSRHSRGIRWSPKPEWVSGIAMDTLRSLELLEHLAWNYLGRVPEEVGLVLHFKGSVLYDK